MSYRDDVMGMGPVAYWRLGEPVGTLALDETFAYQGQYIGTKVLGEAGALYNDPNKAVRWTGNPVGYIDVLTPLAVDATNSFTYSCWFKTNTLLDQTLFSRGPGSCNIRIMANGHIRIYKEGGSILRIWEGSANNGEWHHLAYTRNGSADQVIYIDGAYVDIDNVNDALFEDTGLHLLLGVLTNVGVFFIGTLDEVAVFDRALSAAEVLTLYTTATAPPVPVPSFEVKDPTGTLIVEMRADAAVIAAMAAMAGGDSDTSRITGSRDQKAPPVVIVERMPSNLSPFGPGSGRLGVRGVPYAIKCVAARGKRGDIEATILADVVANFLHLRGPRTREVAGGKVGIFISRVGVVTQVIADPITGDPYVVVNASLEAAAHAVP